MNKNTATYRFLFLFMLFATVPGWLYAQAPAPGTQVARVSPAGTAFLIYVPPGYSPSIPTPLLVNLHGLNQIGSSINVLTSDERDGTPAYLIAQGRWDTSRPFIVVSPQLKRDPEIPNVADQDWPADYVDEVIEYVKTIPGINVNPNKIYLTGLSLGGQGTMIYSAAYPQKVAALVSMSGRTYNDEVVADDVLDDACSLVDIPMWLFHGTDDSQLEYDNATLMVAAIDNCPNAGEIRPRATLLDAGVHQGWSSWNPIFDLSSNYPIYDWLLQFTKSSASNLPPYVTVGPDRKFLVADGSVYVFADYFDFDGSISSISWTQIQGSALTLEQLNANILKVSNLQVGTFRFRLSVTDNLGATGSDEIEIQILANRGSFNAVTELMLTDAAAAPSPIGPLTNGQVINKALLGDDFNVKATMINGGGSLQFSVNSNRNTRMLSGWGDSFNNLYIFDQSYAPEGWNILPGDHIICATPNTRDFVYQSGTEGVSKCVQITVVAQSQQHYYSVSGLDLSLTSSWKSQPDGSGSSPASFTAPFQTFNVTTSSPLNSPLTISGAESALWVRNGGQMTVNSAFDGLINVEGNGVVNVNTNQPVSFGDVSTTSTIRFGSSASSVPAETYGNLEIQSGTKTLPVGTTIVTGNLVIADNAILNGNNNDPSTIQLAGDLTLQENGEFNPATKFGLTLSGNRPHALSIAGSRAVFRELTILGGSVVSTSQNPAAATLELGDGGLVVQNGSELQLGKNNLTIAGSGAINAANQTGEIAFDHSQLSITSQSASSSNLYTKTGADTLSVVVADLAGALLFRDSVFVTDSVKVRNGTLNAGNFLTLVSTPDKTASIARIEGSGSITGNIRFQRSVRPGRMYRYVSVPVEGATVADLQKYMPVTGSFAGASPLAEGPSLYQYGPSGWTPFPSASNTEEFALGRGYSVFVRNVANDFVLKFAGEIHQGDFEFDLHGSSQAEGWNLVGNPYAAPIEWGGPGWQATGMNESVWVRDNEEGEGRFLIWDGEVGDEAFGGMIAQGQAFWVLASTTTPELVVQEVAKTSDQAVMFRTKRSPGSNLTVSLTRPGLVDRAYLKFNDRAGLAFNAQRDGPKRPNNYFNLSVRTSDSVAVAIKNLPDSCAATIGLAVENANPGSYGLEFSGPAFDTREFQLRDNHLDSLIPLSPDGRYEFEVTSLPETFGSKRFELVARVDMPTPGIALEDGKLISTALEGNQWLLDGQEIPGAVGPEYTPVVSGTYQVRVTRSSCYSESSPLAFVVTGTQIRESSIELYPNPAGDAVNVRGISQHTPYTLLNSYGQVVQTGLLTPDHAAIELSIAPGLYILALAIESGGQRHKLVVKK